MRTKHKRTSNTAIFSQDKFRYTSMINLENKIENVIYCCEYDKNVRMMLGFKFGFVVTKLR